MPQSVKYPEISVQLSGTDSNAISIVMNVKRALKRGGVSSAECDVFQKEALSSNYEHVLTTASSWVDVT